MRNSTISWVVYVFPRQALRIAAMVAKIEHRVPLKRAGLPHRIASVVAFLCMPNAAYITGHTICVEGGMTIHGFTLDLSKLEM
jgi:NAD(P)-dependent dehydrogenase (short-subunit alcohol dehydrogenase family)